MKNNLYIILQAIVLGVGLTLGRHLILWSGRFTGILEVVYTFAGMGVMVFLGAWLFSGKKVVYVVANDTYDGMDFD